MLLPMRNSIKCHQVLSLQPMIPPKRFDIFSPCLEDAFRLFVEDVFKAEYIYIFLDVAMVWKGKPASVTTGSRDRTYVRK